MLNPVYRHWNFKYQTLYGDNIGNLMLGVCARPNVFFWSIRTIFSFWKEYRNVVMRAYTVRAQMRAYSTEMLVMHAYTASPTVKMYHNTISREFEQVSDIKQKEIQANLR